ncbi:Dehydrodolichyl diphosphate syntase complex subunit DHDDS [Orchesella cincta]|uniref:Alkyl transferase n=1 Tax=Orchesella cincta TaxID=48709 RepID=A0A1D2M3L4_ORCCI|nr:Dehydrodolichyl diphosphate syntase complex subunit DHDDS [Orchesella cincta]
MMAASETLLEKLFRKILQQGSIPNHVALILDGNRRYARENNMQTIEGHRKGKNTFKKLVNWNAICGVKEVTVFAFSIQNFNRSTQEVNDLMALFRSTIHEILGNKEIMTNGRVQFIGNWPLFPKDLKPLISKLMVDTRNNTKITVNIAFAYAGRDEITSGVKNLLHGVANKALTLSNVNEDLLDKSLQLYSMSPVDLLIRTGECRLSDFLAWGSSDHAVICFRDEYWPSFTYWGLLECVFYYQANKFRIQQDFQEEEKNYQQSWKFLSMLKKGLWKTVENHDERQRNFGVQ